MKIRLLKRKTELFLSYRTQVMSDLCQERANNDVTTGSQNSTGMIRPSGILYPNQIHKNGHVHNGLGYRCLFSGV